MQSSNSVFNSSNSKKKYLFIYYLRFIAMFMVMWPHLTYVINPNWELLHFVQLMINTPLKIADDFGQFGVSLFFLISGFLLLQSQRDKYKFLISNIIKIEGVLLLSTILFFLVQILFSIITNHSNYWQQFTIIDWIKNCTLWSWLELGPGIGINGVLWYLIPLWILYIISFLFKSHFSKNKILFGLLIDCFVMCSYVYIYTYPESIFVNILTYMHYVEMSVIGLKFYLLVSNDINLKKFLFSVLISYIILILGFQINQPAYYEQVPYMVSFTYAFLIFIIAYLCNDKLKEIKAVIFFSDISYSFYITHSLYGGLVLSFLYPILEFSLSFVITIPVCIGAAYINYILIEKKLISLTSSLLKNRK